MDSTRVNSECRWSDDGTGALDLAQPTDRDHLRVDVKVAGELALRMADARFRNRPIEARPIFEKCMTARLLRGARDLRRTAALRFRATPLTGSNDSYAARLRPRRT